MKYIYIAILFICFSFSANAQVNMTFTIKKSTTSANKASVYVKPIGADISTTLQQFECFVRIPSTHTYTLNVTSNNSTDFPALSSHPISNSGLNFNGAEAGYNIHWLKKDFTSGGTPVNYVQDQEYELFTFELTGGSAGQTLDVQLAANSGELNYYIVMSGSAGDLIDPNYYSGDIGANIFYGDNATTETIPSLLASTSYFEGAESVALPITLSTFTARAINNKDAHLKWTTESEINGSHFELERSMDGVNFDKIATIAATGSEDLGADYTYTDADVNDRTRDDVVRYYRLKMVDLDGEYKYSGIRNVNFTIELTDFNMEIYPNPTVDQVQIEMTGIDNTIAERPMLQIYDNSGALIQSRELDSDLGKIDMRDLPSKMYHFMITYKGQNYAQKIIKM